MSRFAKDVDVAFQGAGTKIGLEVWCVENLNLVPVPKSSHGNFFSGSAYLILNTIVLKDGILEHDVHYWLGKDANEVDSLMVSDKALELDLALGSCTVQYQEKQGQESAKFLSYFKPCIIPCEGVYTSGPERSDRGTYHMTLLACKGERAISVKEVPFSRSSFNHEDVFILDTESKIYLFSGHNSSIQERAKALEVIKYIKEEKHGGKCQVATIEDGKFVGDSDAGEFWSFFGGYAPISRDSSSFFKKQHDAPFVKLFWINIQGKLCETSSGFLTREVLDREKCYMLDCDAEVFVWMGSCTSITERKTLITAVEDFLRSQGRSTRSLVIVLTEGAETPKFKSYFVSWPQTDNLKLYEEGKEKVAAIFKQQGYNVKELPEEFCQPLINCRGKLEVWVVNGEHLSIVPSEAHIKLFTGDCYIIKYTYPSSQRDESILYAWLGFASVKEDRVDAISHMIDMADSTKGTPVLVQIFEGKEPDQFFWVTQRLIVFKGGTSTRYRNSIAEKGIEDCTFNAGSTALFRLQGSSPENMQAIQVNMVAGSLNSSYCYIVRTEEAVFSWIGSLTSSRDHDLLDRMLELLNPDWQPKSLREGGEPDEFWMALGGKSEYPREKEIRKHKEDPHLFVCNCSEDDFKVKEIFSFTQDDLTTEDIFILDCYIEIYVWIGSQSIVKSKLQAIQCGMNYLERDILAQGLLLETPLYIVTERHEPEFFTCFFDWDVSKSHMDGNSFERKLALLRGEKKLETPPRSSCRAHSSEYSRSGSRSKSVSCNGVPRSASPSSFSKSHLISSNGGAFSSPDVIAKKLFSEQSANHSSTVDFHKLDSGNSAETVSSSLVAENDDDDDSNLLIYPYERLMLTSDEPVSDIDVTKREAYLSKAEFQEKFGMTKRAFYTLPKWRQNNLKVSLNLF
ncbi:villin-1-like isoform X1 [Chenopodium quinoa]|uniref:villin-1-like isoform X1 n=1 Tax=Chenopodium quinoa TaxID=63459 RepID=UPI000B78B909|nr:villin-1-like isoform X1 [Chenopodium quinoa]